MIIEEQKLETIMVAVEEEEGDSDIDSGIERRTKDDKKIIRNSMGNWWNDFR